MSIRETLNQKPGLIAGIAAVACVVAIGALLFSTGVIGGPPPATAGDTYYMDLETGELFVAQTGSAPQSPDGNPAAQATVFGCGGCDEEQLIVGHLIHEVPPDERPAGMGEVEAVRVSEDGNRWHPINSPEGASMTRRPSCEDGSRAQRCVPGR